ncbi:hypothetical protein [Paractinoplanes rishiriensis]|uniref:Uncharacterized protein n=1 Tax=Paractinoplanes rishiriensis TaxID=1050105 RepID=A0A919K5K4_9ACTN|nr:hypothetical protein [Actinoplanes rishiriensis]GIF01312.1 hypothetical protein Ari01nite_87760 [Actinoplanes rishiriensis]
MNAVDQRTVAAISRGSRDAFILLFDRTSGAVRAEIASRLDADRSATVFAATYVEVWWLAGCHSGPEIDAMEWIKNILRRRLADADLDTRQQASNSDPAPGLRPSCAELELAFLLGRPVTRWPV